MTNSSSTKKCFKSKNRKRLWFLVLSRGGLAFGGLLVVGISVGIWRLQVFIQQDLAPLVEKNLTNIIDRPLELGEVEGFSLSGVRFGASAVPKTATDADTVKADAIEVGFDPLKLLFNRRLKLDITLVNPVGYVDRDEQGRWITTKIVLPEEPGAIAIDVDKVNLRNGSVTLMPFGENRQVSPKVVFSELNGYAKFFDNYQTVRFEVGGKPGRSGNVSVRGKVGIKTKTGNLQLLLEDLIASEVTPLVELPVKLQGGKINGDLQVKLPFGEKIQPLLYGKARVEGLNFQVARMPKPLVNSVGNLQFDGTKVRLNDVVTSYGKIPLSGGGIIDWKTGYDLTARVNAVSVNDTLQTLDIQSPLPVGGVVKGDLKMTGAITQPVISGTVATVKPGIVDKVKLKTASGKFAFVTADSTITFTDIRGTAAVGGDVRGAGKILIGDDTVGRSSQVNFNFLTSNAPGDSLATIYDIPTPSFQVGKVAAAANLSGTPETIRTLVKFNAPQATYPATGEVIVNRDRSLKFQSALAVAGGTALAYGSWNQQRWQAVANTKGIKINQFVSREQLEKVNLESADFNGKVIVSGSSTPFKIAQIKTENADIKVAGGRVAVNSVKFDEQQFSADLVASGVQVGRLLKNVSLPINGSLSGKFQVSGNTSNFDMKTLQVRGNAGLRAAGGIITASDIQVKDGVYLARVKANNLQLQQLSEQIPKSFKGKLRGDFNVAGSLDSLQPESIVANGKAEIVTAGGAIAANNIQVKNGVYLADVVANNVRVRELSQQIPQSFAGGLSGKFNVAGSLDSFAPENLIVSGRGNLNTAAGKILARDIEFARGEYRAKVKVNNIDVRQLSPQVPSSFPGKLTGNFDIAGSTKSLEDLTISGNGFVNAAGGRIAASDIAVYNGRYQAKVVASDLLVRQLSPQIPKSFSGRLTGKFDVAGSVNSFEDLTASGNAAINTGAGKIAASDILVSNGKYQAVVAANQVNIKKIAPQVPEVLAGTLTGKLNIAGSLNSFDSLTAAGNAAIDAAGGRIAASNIQLKNGSYQAVVNAANLELNQLNQNLRGKFNGNLQIAGNWKNPSLADVRANGNVQFSQGIPGFEKPIDAAIAWNGNKLRIARASAPGLYVSGDIFANAKSAGIPTITQLDLNVRANDFDLKQLPVDISNAVKVAGKVDFNGKITGKLPLPNILGQVALKDFAVNDIAFEPVLAGNVKSQQGSGLQLNVAGKQDKIAVNLNGDNRPESFLIKRGEAFASGESQGDILALNVNKFPLRLLKLPLPVNRYLGSGKIAGEFSGNLRINQKTFATASGEIAVKNPEVGRLKGDRLVANFNYNGKKLRVIKGEFIKGESSYSLAGTVTKTDTTPQIKGTVNVKEGKIQDVLTALQIYELEDIQRGLEEPTYGKANQLETTPVGLPNQSLLTQLRRYSEIQALLAQQKQQRRDASPFPELGNLKGTFNGEISLDTAEDKGISTQFDIKGKNFTWGTEEDPERYKAQQVIAQGAFENGVLRLIPLRIESTNRLFSFSGAVGGDEQYGTLQVNNFPIEVLNSFINLPVGLTGNLNGRAALAGSVGNPLTKGEFRITDGTLNQKGIESAAASFSYSNGRLNFASNIMVNDAEPVDINGSIPYKLPFASVAPESNQINLDVNVKNEGLAVLNLISNQATFEKGEGEIQLTVRGTLQEPVVNGNATLNNATFSAQALPEKLTNVTGKVQFDFDTIVIDALQGDFSRGKVVAKGEIPIYDDQFIQINNPLAVTLDKLAINLKGLYQGGVGGKVVVKGSALSPIISGNINLSNGLVLLPENETETAAASSSKIKRLQANKQIDREENARGKFDNLKLTLGKDVKVERPPIISITAKGLLNVNGTFSNPIPVGTLKLKKGGVNLFTTQFNIDKGEENTAIFIKNQPRDPILDISLFAKVLDVIQNSDFSRANATGLAALETVRVEAQVNGPASKINENLELKSSPARTETEIVALLGGGFDGEGRASSAVGLLNIAGSAVFGNLQTAFNEIGTAFGLDELRVFPTIISDNPDAGKSNSTVELAAEAGVDVTDKISISALKILTADDPFQFGINYRLKDRIRLRGSTNFDDDSRAVIEYQRRF
ncbi:MAG: translocation/assembly module TamB domain-containing protein [Rivularia sp. (in: Bacteria)]|nr:translocation/assembly module TamB domain-containing protein [Rivularia sp. MS3]